MRTFRAFFILCFFASCAIAAPLDIVVSLGKYSDYYHIRLKLHSDDFELSIPTSSRTPKYSENNDFRFEEGGQFEVFIKRDAFPIPLKGSPNSKYIILRMPWTNPETPGASLFINEKRRIFDELTGIKKSHYESLTVVVELNPYIEVQENNPLSLQLTEPNVFFRQAFGRYINYTGPLKPEDKTQTNR